jgi:beta-N-acetylglucosaminidase
MKKYMKRVLAIMIIIAVILSMSVTAANAADQAYINSLISAGFPADYAALLEQVHQRHPTWTFTPIVTGLNFDDAVAGESKDDYTTTDITVSYNLLISRNRGTYNSDGSYTYKIVDGNQQKQTGHADASDLCISYFMDPRNFILEDRVLFQFLDMSYPANDSGILTALETITKGTFLENAENGKKQYQMFMEAGQESGVSPIYLVSRTLQEVGTDGTNGQVSGTYPGYEGYYNYFSVGAYASTTGGQVANGLKYAKDHGWNTREKAIKGGAAFIANGYINVGQHTPYLTKFNVNPATWSHYSKYTHQYMSAVNDPAQTARTVYNAYKNANILDSIAINFAIPVYKNMPNFASTSIKLNDTTNSVVGKEPTASSFSLRNAPYYGAPTVTKVNNGTSMTILERVRSSKVATDSVNVYAFTLQLPFWYKVTANGTTAYTAYENVPITSNVTMKIGDKRTFGYSLTNGVTGAVRFEMLDSRIASVNILTGEVVAKATGTTQLIAYTASGSVDYINITVTKADGVPSQITSGTLNIDQSAKLVSGINIGTTVQTLINSVNEKNYVAVYKGGTKQSNTTPLATGMTLALVINGNVVKQYEIAVTGDTNCDGSLGPGDAVLVLRHLSGLQTLSGAVLKAADSNKDNSIGPGDAVTILRAIG